MLHLALSERLIEALAQRQIRLTLGALQELFNFPGACTLWLIGTLCRLRIVWLLLLLLNWRGSGWRCGLLIARAAEHGRQSMADGVANR